MDCDELLEQFEKRQQRTPELRDKMTRTRSAKVVLGQSPIKSSEKRRNDDYGKLLQLPLGGWESVIVSVDHVSEPEDDDLVVHVKMYISAHNNSTAKRIINPPFQRDIQAELSGG